MSRDELLAAMQPIHLLEPYNYTVVVLGMVVIIIAMVLVRQLIRKPLLRWRQQHLALVELAEIKKTYHTDNDGAQLARGVSILLRRYALVRFPDADVAGLSGQCWLNFLAQHSDNNYFTSERGTLLITAPYQRSLTIDVSDLLVHGRHWIKLNR